MPGALHTAELHGKKAFVPWLAPDMDPEHFEEITLNR
jgi:hypothetical protein